MYWIVLILNILFYSLVLNFQKTGRKNDLEIAKVFGVMAFYGTMLQLCTNISSGYWVFKYESSSSTKNKPSRNDFTIPLVLSEIMYLLVILLFLFGHDEYTEAIRNLIMLHFSLILIYLSSYILTQWGGSVIPVWVEFPYFLSRGFVSEKK